MRYASEQYGEHPIAVGIFSPGDTVTIKVFNLATPAAGELALDTNVCTEVQLAAGPPHTGRFVWDYANLTVQPTSFTQLSHIMTNQNGRQHDGKPVIGGFPSDSAVRRFAGAVHIDTTNGSAGTTFPLGTQSNPVNNVTDARTIANRENLTAYHIKGPVTIVADHEDWTFEGVTPASDIVTVQSPASVDRSTFRQIGIRGDLTGNITGEQAIIGEPQGLVTGLSGTFTECGFDGTIRPAPAPGKIQGLRLSALASNILNKTTFLDYNNQLCVVIAELKGIWSVRNMSAGLPATTLAVSLAGCQLTLESSVAGGNIIIISDGTGELIDNKTGATTFDDFLARGTHIHQIRHHTKGRAKINTGDPAQWKVDVYNADNRTTVEDSFDLKQLDGTPINDANPLEDPVIADVDPV